ncbi:alpha/beta hydrolase [Sphaerisporangium sp. NPDC051017]|uniref:alpha/beta hydrolase family protein n=1 Tax=Sphaerisporangium sp. NPDC051017 TaxID=3154636 RepID=UPI00342B956C
MRVVVLTGPVADERLLREVAGAETAVLGVPARFAAVDGAAALEAELGATSGDCAVVAVPGPSPDVRRLMDVPAAYSPRTVWLDLERTGPIPVAGGAAHQQGRGVAGLIWAIRHAVHRLRWPARRIAYGDHPDQWADLRLPMAASPPAPRSGPSESESVPTAEPREGAARPVADAPPPVATDPRPYFVKDVGPARHTDPGADGVSGTGRDRVTGTSTGSVADVSSDDLTGAGSGEVAGMSSDDVAGTGPDDAIGGGGTGSRPPVVVLVHGGYWRSIWGADLMDALAIDLARRGIASWNLEYRRPDLHGWDATTADVAAGIAALRSLDVPVDLDRVAVAGHSAGGQLALRAAADAGGAVAVAVSLAGVLDLVEGYRRHMSSGAVHDALGGTPEEIPETYAAASPLLRLPLGVPQIVVQGASDDLDLVDMARRYTSAAGDEATYIERPGDHWSVIDPSTPIWAHTARELTTRLTPRHG